MFIIMNVLKEVSKMKEKIIKVRTPFSNATEFEVWKSRNCDNCKIYEYYFEDELDGIKSCPVLDCLELGYEYIDWDFLKTFFTKDGNCLYKVNKE